MAGQRLGSSGDSARNAGDMGLGDSEIRDQDHFGTGEVAGEGMEVVIDYSNDPMLRSPTASSQPEVHPPPLESEPSAAAAPSTLPMELQVSEESRVEGYVPSEDEREKSARLRRAQVAEMVEANRNTRLLMETCWYDRRQWRIRDDVQGQLRRDVLAILAFLYHASGSAREQGKGAARPERRREERDNGHLSNDELRRLIAEHQAQVNHWTAVLRGQGDARFTEPELRQLIAGHQAEVDRWTAFLHQRQARGQGSGGRRNF